MGAVRQISVYIVPMVIAFVLVYGYLKGVNLYEMFIEGAKEGLRISVNILPFLITMLFAIAIFRESGALSVFTRAFSPLLRLIGIPPEVLPLVLMKPLSGSGALGITAEIIQKYGADSQTGRIAAVMMGSTETIFYTMSIYYGAVGIKKTRHTLPAALIAHAAGVVASCVICRYFFGQ